MKHEYMKINILLESLPSGLIFRESIKISHPQNWKVYYRMLNELVEEGLVASGLRIKTEKGVKYRFTYFGLTVAGLYYLNHVITSFKAKSIFDEIQKPIDEYGFLSILSDTIKSLFPDGDVPLDTIGFYNKSLQFIITNREQSEQTSLLEIAGVKARTCKIVPDSVFIQSSNQFTNEYATEETDVDFPDSLQDDDEGTKLLLNNRPISPKLLSRLKTNGTMVAAIVQEAINQYESKNRSSNDVNENIDPIPNKAIYYPRRYFIPSLASSGDSHYLFAQCSGMILRTNDFILTFHCGLSGTAWSKKSAQKLRGAIDGKFKQARISYKAHDAIIFSKNIFQLKNAIYDPKKKRTPTTDEGTTILGSGFRYTYIVLEIAESILPLKTIIMSEDAMKETQQLILHLFPDLKLGKDQTLRFIDSDGRKYADGLLMETHIIHKMVELQEKEEPFRLICFDWQESYYDDILPFVEKRTIETIKPDF